MTLWPESRIILKTQARKALFMWEGSTRAKFSFVAKARPCNSGRASCRFDLAMFRFGF